MIQYILLGIVLIILLWITLICLSYFIDGWSKRYDVVFDGISGYVTASQLLYLPVMIFLLFITILSFKVKYMSTFYSLSILGCIAMFGLYMVIYDYF